MADKIERILSADATLAAKLGYRGAEERAGRVADQQYEAAKEEELTTVELTAPTWLDEFAHGVIENNTIGKTLNDAVTQISNKHESDLYGWSAEPEENFVATYAANQEKWEAGLSHDEKEFMRDRVRSTSDVIRAREILLARRQHEQVLAGTPLADSLLYGLVGYLGDPIAKGVTYGVASLPRYAQGAAGKSSARAVARGLEAGAVEGAASYGAFTALTSADFTLGNAAAWTAFGSLGGALGSGHYLVRRAEGEHGATVVTQEDQIREPEEITAPAAPVTPAPVATPAQQEAASVVDKAVKSTRGGNTDAQAAAIRKAAAKVKDKKVKAELTKKAREVELSGAAPELTKKAREVELSGAAPELTKKAREVELSGAAPERDRAELTPEKGEVVSMVDDPAIGKVADRAAAVGGTMERMTVKEFKTARKRGDVDVFYRHSDGKTVYAALKPKADKPVVKVVGGDGAVVQHPDGKVEAVGEAPAVAKELAEQLKPVAAAKKARKPKPEADPDTPVDAPEPEEGVPGGVGIPEVERLRKRSRADVEAQLERMWGQANEGMIPTKMVMEFEAAVNQAFPGRAATADVSADAAAAAARKLNDELMTKVDEEVTTEAPPAVKRKRAKKITEKAIDEAKADLEKAAPAPVALPVTAPEAAPAANPVAVDELKAKVQEDDSSNVAKLSGVTSTRSPEMDKEVESADFKAWAGNSAVSDASGKPAVLYHGTPKGGFEEFRTEVTEQTTGSPMARLGAWFTPDEEVAKEASRGFGAVSAVDPQVYAVYVRSHNPYVVRGEGKTDGLTELGNQMLAAGGPEKFRQSLLESGYTGIHVWTDVDTLGKGKQWQVVVFNPTDIKAAGAGTNFSVDTPNIYGKPVKVKAEPPVEGKDAEVLGTYVGQAKLELAGAYEGAALTKMAERVAATRFELLKRQMAAIQKALAGVNRLSNPQRGVGLSTFIETYRGVREDYDVIIDSINKALAGKKVQVRFWSNPAERAVIYQELGGQASKPAPGLKGEAIAVAGKDEYHILLPYSKELADPYAIKETGLYAENVLHEALHIVTGAALRPSKKGVLSDFRKEVDELMRATASQLADTPLAKHPRVRYMLSSADEFVSVGLTDVAMQRVLKKLHWRTKEDDSTTLFGGFARAIKRLLGLEGTQPSIMEGLVEAYDAFANKQGFNPEFSYTNGEMDRALMNIDLIPDEANRAMTDHFVYSVVPDWEAKYGVDADKIPTLLANFPNLQSGGVRGLMGDRMLRAFTAAFMEIPTGAAGRSATSPAIEIAKKYQLFMSNGLARTEKYYSQWAKQRMGWIRRVQDEVFAGKLRAEWYAEIAKQQEWKWANNGADHPAVTDPLVKLAAAELDKGYTLMAKQQVQHGVEGHQNLWVGRPGYRPRVLSIKKWMEAPDALRKHFVSAYADDLFQAWGGTPQARLWADEIAKQRVEHVLNQSHGFVPIRSLTHDSELSAIMGLINSTVGRHNANLALSYIADLKKRPMKHTASRLDVDMFSGFTDNNGRYMELWQLFEHDERLLYPSYSRRVAGNIGLTYRGFTGETMLEQFKYAMSRAPEGWRAETAEQQQENMRVFDQLCAELLGRPFGTANLAIDNMVAITGSARLGGQAFPMLGDMLQMVFHAGMENFTKHYMGSMVSLAKGVHKLEHKDDVALKAFEEFTGVVGYDYHVAFPYLPHSSVAGIDQVEAGKFTRAVNGVSWAAKYVSLYQGMKTSQERGAFKLLVHRSIGEAQSYMKTGEIDPLVRDMGFDEQMLSDIYQALPHIAQFDKDGNLTHLDLRSAPAAFVERWSTSLMRGSAQMVQQTFAGEVPRAFHSSIGRALLQFRGTALVAMEKQMMRQYQTAGGARFVGMVAAGIFWGMMLHTIRVALASSGMDEQRAEEYRAAMLSPLSMTRASLNYTLQTGLLGDLVDLSMTATAAGLMGVEDSDGESMGKAILAQLGKPSIGGALTDNIPSLGYLNSLGKAAAGLTTVKDEEWSPDLYRAYRVIPIVGYNPALAPLAAAALQESPED